MAPTTNTELAEIFAIDDLDTLKLLMAEPRIEIIELLRTPRSVAELADLMDVPRTRLYHHINSLDEVGAIVVVDERRAGAMTEKIYRVAAKRFAPSDTFLESAPPREQAHAVLDSLFSVTKRDMIQAVERKQFTLGEAEKQRQLMMGRYMLVLTPDRRSELITRLESLIEEFNDDEETSEAAPFGLLLVAHPSSRTTA